MIRLLLRLIWVPLAMSVILAGCGEKEEEKAPVVRSVKSMVIQDKQTKILRSFPGKVLPNQNAIIAFEVPGKIEALEVKKGDEVKKGEELARLDPSQYRDQVHREKASYDERLAQFKRAQVLIKDAYISQSDYDKLKSQMEIAKANLNTAELKLSYTKVTAPFDGIIAKRFVENFEQIKAKQSIMEIQDISNVDVEIDIPENIVIHFKQMEKDKSKLSEKDIPRVYFESLPDASFPLSLKEFTVVADPKTQTYALRMTLPQPKNITVLPGMSVTVKAYLPDVTGSMEAFNLIPSSAVFTDPKNKPSVWVIDPKTFKVHLRHIEVSKLTDDQIRVENGLKPGERIVTAGVHFIREGQTVKLMDADMLSKAKDF